MSDVTKTYSGQQSYHEMLIRAQALSPVLTYLLCSLFLSTKIDTRLKMQQSTSIPLHDDKRWAERTATFGVYFDREPGSSKMSRFIKEVFGGFTVEVGWSDTHGHVQHLFADTPFVQWLQSGVVTMDESKLLVTINL